MTEYPEKNAIPYKIAIIAGNENEGDDVHNEGYDVHKEDDKDKEEDAEEAGIDEVVEEEQTENVKQILLTYLQKDFV